MIKRHELERYLAQLLDVAKIDDYTTNGLQIEGKENISNIALAVTASQDVINTAIQWQADALLVHHGYFWKGELPTIIGIKASRIKSIMQADMSLFAYHLPLDIHPELGNNIALGQELALQQIQSFTIQRTPNILWSGVCDTHTPDSLIAKLKALYNREPIWIEGKNKNITKIAWCTGAAQDYIENASALGVDAFISGEISERTYYLAKELGIHYFAAGHHATERSGVQRLGQHLKDKFNLNTQFFDSNNPV